MYVLLKVQNSYTQQFTHYCTNYIPVNVVINLWFVLQNIYEPDVLHTFFIEVGNYVVV